MSTTGQAFVKAFARGGHSTRPNPISNEATTLPHDGSNSRVESASGTWIAGPEDRFTRIDSPQFHVTPSSVPAGARQREGVSGQESSTPESAGALNVAALQHMHTAYEPQAAPGQATSGSREIEERNNLGQETDSIGRDQPGRSVAIPLVANWEIDVFDLPPTVADLFFDDGLFNDLSDRMLQANRGGLRTMLITSLLAGEGRSSVAMGMAMTAAASGLKVALVDADFSSPSLADDFRLDLDFGWIDHIRERAPIGETAVHAMEDNVTLFPLLAGRSSDQATPAECNELVASLRSHFDLIIIDGEIAHEIDIRPMSREIDSAVIVYDPSQSSDLAVKKTGEQLRANGVSGIGCVENFV